MSDPSVVAARTPLRPASPVYTVTFVPRRELALGRDDDDAQAVGPRTSGTMRLVVREDDTLEYQLTVQNEERITFTGGRLYRGDPGSGGTEVATLFAGVNLSSRYIQLRGTGIVSRGVDVRELMDILRTKPNAFMARIDARSGKSQSLVGPLR